MPDLGSLTTATLYAVVCGLVFAECGLLVGFLLPGDTVLFAAGLPRSPAAGCRCPCSPAASSSAR